MFQLTNDFHHFHYQLHAKFDQLKKQHADEKKKIDDAKRQLEEDINLLQKRKMAAATAAQHATMGKKGKK